MNEKQAIIKFIRNVTSNNFKEANSNLTAIVNEKIKQRIREQNTKLTKSK